MTCLDLFLRSVFKEAHSAKVYFLDTEVGKSAAISFALRYGYTFGMFLRMCIAHCGMGIWKWEEKEDILGVRQTWLGVQNSKEFEILSLSLVF